MRQSRVYCQHDLKKALQTATPFLMDERNSHYLLKVLRVKPGQALVLFDGDGCDYNARVVEVTRRSLSVIVESVIEKANAESPLHTVLSLGISKGDRMDFAVQKAVELGVSEIQPLITERVTINKTPERLQKKREHLQSVVISACEQSGRNIIPAIQPVMLLNDWLMAIDQRDHAMNLTFKVGGQPLAALLSNTDRPAMARLLVGPEGGLAEREIALAEQKGFIGVGMGPRVLRTETAPLVALSLLQSVCGDLR